MKLLLFHGQMYGLLIGLVLLVLSAAITVVFFLTGAFRKSKLVILLWVFGLLLALFCFIFGCFFVWVGLQEFYYLYFD